MPRWPSAACPPRAPGCGRLRKPSISAYVGCLAGAIPLEEYRQGLLSAGFAHVEVLDSGSDLNAYAKLENQAGCCRPPAASALPVLDSPCCSPEPPDTSALHARLAELLRRYNVNDYAASVRVLAVKPLA